jgi:predicted AAA+ superfamily ATPase
MKIERTSLKELIRWKSSSNRKPLILRGARQVGKTWLLKEFGSKEFESCAYFNFEEEPELKQFFLAGKDVQRIIQNLSLVNGKAITAGTLLIFDEIQECNEALNSLKYFYENVPGQPVVCAGSLLGIALSRGYSFPVGKVDFLDLFPLSFTEFLSAADPALSSYMDSINKIEPIPDLFFNRLIERFKMYLISGGMPEPANTLIEKYDVSLVQQLLKNIIDAYSLDFSKHAENRDVAKIGYIWSSIPSQLARENKKFLFQAVKQGARAREYENALHWLVQAGLVYKIFRNSKPALPLAAYDDITAFKLYLLDVGLLRRMAMLDPSSLKEGNRLFTEFKGALSENYILQSLVRQFEGIPRYWTSEGKAELDFLIQIGNDILPVEVKSDENVAGKSLTFYHKKYPSPVRLRYSTKNLDYNNGLLNIPLFMADHTKELIRIVNS